jgi:hypothetical protein
MPDWSETSLSPRGVCGRCWSRTANCISASRLAGNGYRNLEAAAEALTSPDNLGRRTRRGERVRRPDQKRHRAQNPHRAATPAQRPGIS